MTFKNTLFKDRFSRFLEHLQCVLPYCKLDQLNTQSLWNFSWIAAFTHQPFSFLFFSSPIQILTLCSCYRVVLNYKELKQPILVMNWIEHSKYQLLKKWWDVAEKVCLLGRWSGLCSDPGYGAVDAHTPSIFNLRMDMVDDGSPCNGSGPWLHCACTPHLICPGRACGIGLGLRKLSKQIVICQTTPTCSVTRVQTLCSVSPWLPCFHYCVCQEEQGHSLTGLSSKSF